MASIKTEEPAEGSNSSRRQNALAEIRFASIIESDVETPSEDEATNSQDYLPEDAQSIMGVSIGREQTRLTSPTTPAAEKVAAMEDLDGGGLFADHWDGVVEETVGGQQEEVADEKTKHEGLSERDDLSSLPAASSTSKAPNTQDVVQRLPSPWRAGPKKFQRFEESRAALRESFGRRRASSGGSATEAFRKLMSFNLPALPKSPNFSNFSLQSLPYLSSFDGGYDIHRLKGSSKPESSMGDASLAQTNGLNGTGQSSDTDIPTSPRQRRATVQLTAREASQPSRSTFSPQPRATTSPVDHQHPPALRRSTSDNSLLIHRSFSRASSLGDDTRFEHVQEQVNSRFKAVRDSLQDASFRLPRISSVTNSFHDLLQPRSSSSLSSTGSPIPPSNRKTVPNPTTLLKAALPSTKKTDPTSYKPSVQFNPNFVESHPYFVKAMSQLEGDVVILGGYRGSVLRSATPPYEQVWIPMKVGLGLRKVNLAVGLTHADEESMEQSIVPDGMLKNIGIVDVSKRLFKKLRKCQAAEQGRLRVHDWGYDWRLSPHLLSRKLQKFLASLPCNQPGTTTTKRGATVIAHSLGGLITRHAVNENPELFSGVIYAGVPQTCVNILGPLRNGDDVGLSSRVLTAEVNFTLRTSFLLLPLSGDCFFNKETREEFGVDFFDPQTWIEYRLSPCVAPALPPLHPPPSTGLSGIISSMSSVLPNIMHRRSSGPRQPGRIASPSEMEERGRTSAMTANAKGVAETGAEAGMAPQMNTNNAANPAEYGNSTQSSPSTAVTIPRDKAIDYLKRTLPEIKRFKEELRCREKYVRHNRYPPMASIYSKSTPTVYGAKVESREHIKHADAYSELAFASGDGVVLAKAAMLPPGYTSAACISSDRGHVTLLGDLEAVGKCLVAVLKARREGVGLGEEKTFNLREETEEQEHERVEEVNEALEIPKRKSKLAKGY